MLTHSNDLVIVRFEKDVGVVIEATHSCMTLRGIKKPNSRCITSAMTGVFMDDASTRSEFLNLVMKN